MKSRVHRLLPRLWKGGDKGGTFHKLDLSKEHEMMGLDGGAPGGSGEKGEPTILAGMHTENVSELESWVSGGSNVSSSSAGDPQHTPSQPVSLNNSRLSVTQTIVEPGANRWEVHGLWMMKRCARTTSKSLSKISTQMMVVVLSTVVISFATFCWYNGPEREVKRFLADIGLGEYYDNFIEQKYTWLEDMVHISKVEDLQALGMTYRSHQERFLRHAEKLRNQESLVLAIMWAIFIMMIMCSLIVVASILVFEEARNRAAFFVTWCCLMMW